MDHVSLGDLLQLGAAAPFCWLYWQSEKGHREERERNRQTLERLAIAVELLVMGLTGRPLNELIRERGRDVQQS
jgi:hypothetical protein